MAPMAEEAFEHKRYPQIRTIVLPACEHSILRACPNVVDVTCNDGSGSQIISAMTEVCKDVEVMEGVMFDWAAPITRELSTHFA